MNAFELSDLDRQRVQGGKLYVIPVATSAEAAAEVATRLRRRASPRHVRGVDAGNLEFPGSAY